MTDRDIVMAYKKGISIITISKRYRDYKNKSNLSAYRRNSHFTMERRFMSLEKARKYVEKVILEYKKGRFDLLLD